MSIWFGWSRTQPAPLMTDDGDVDDAPSASDVAAEPAPRTPGPLDALRRRDHEFGSVRAERSIPRSVEAASAHDRRRSQGAPVARRREGAQRVSRSARRGSRRAEQARVRELRRVRRGARRATARHRSRSRLERESNRRAHSRALVGARCRARRRPVAHREGIPRARRERAELGRVRSRRRQTRVGTRGAGDPATVPRRRRSRGRERRHCSPKWPRPTRHR